MSTARGELQEQPAVRARLLNVFGKIYNWLQLYETSEPILVEALELTREVIARACPALADAPFVKAPAWSKPVAWLRRRALRLLRG